jgi:hypothetical protein
VRWATRKDWSVEEEALTVGLQELITPGDDIDLMKDQWLTAKMSCSNQIEDLRY